MTKEKQNKMNNNANSFPFMLKLVYSGDKVYCPFNLCLFIEGENGIISSIKTASFNEVLHLESTDHRIVRIKDLNCKTYDELIVNLDLNGLFHGFIEIPYKDLIKKYNDVQRENENLKAKFNLLKDFIMK